MKGKEWLPLVLTMVSLPVLLPFFKKHDFLNAEGLFYVGFVLVALVGCLVALALSFAVVRAVLLFGGSTHLVANKFAVLSVLVLGVGASLMGVALWLE